MAPFPVHMGLCFSAQLCPSLVSSNLTSSRITPVMLAPLPLWLLLSVNSYLPCKFYSIFQSQTFSYVAYGYIKITFSPVNMYQAASKLVLPSPHGSLIPTGSPDLWLSEPCRMFDRTSGRGAGRDCSHSAVKARTPELPSTSVHLRSLTQLPRPASAPPCQL